MEKYLIKKLGHQELGYRNKDSNIPGVSRGQYFLVSKKYLDFFPPLKKEIPQDLQILNFVTHTSNTPSQVKYIYDNDKFHGSTANSPRNEHRINLNLKVNPEKQVFFKDDIIVIKKESFTNENGFDESAFIVTRYRKDLNTNDYNLLSRVLNSNSLGSNSRNYCIANELDLKPIESFRDRLFNRVLPNEVLIPIADTTLIDVSKNYFSKDENELRNYEQQMKRIIFDKYNYRCLVSDIGFKWSEQGEIKNSWRGITGAHIKPRVHGGPYNSNNIIPLIEPVHQIFDKGVFRITSEHRIEIHQKALKDPLLSNFHSFNDKKIQLPNGINLSQDYLAWHKDHIYGNFIHGLGIRSLN